jgi:hypothetical protein
MQITILLLVALTVMSNLLIVSKLKYIQRKTKNMLTKTDLDNAIAALPGAITSAVEAAMQPVIQAIQDKAGSIDFQPEIDQLNAIGANVATKIAADLMPAPAAPTNAPAA